MEALTIHTLITMIRSFSNEITTTGLARKLGISYSTLARCKNGVWPPSITFDAMKSIFDGCLSEVFSDDADAFVHSALGFLSRENIATASLQKRFEDGGYDAFVTELICDAQQNPHVNHQESCCEQRDSSSVRQVPYTERYEARSIEVRDESNNEPYHDNRNISWQDAAALLVVGALVIKLVDALFIVSVAKRFQVPYLKKTNRDS